RAPFDLAHRHRIPLGPAARGPETTPRQLGCNRPQRGRAACLDLADDGHDVGGELVRLLAIRLDALGCDLAGGVGGVAAAKARVAKLLLALRERLARSFAD